MKPLFDRVLVREVFPSEEQSKGGIFIPETATRHKPRFGEVVEVGPGMKAPLTGGWMATTTQKGVIVLFSTYAGMDIRIADETYIMLREAEILSEVDDFPMKGVDESPPPQ